MSLNFDLREIPEETRTIIATEDDAIYGIKKGDRIMSPVTKALIWSTMSIGIGEITDETAPEFAARLDFLQRLDGPFLQDVDEDGEWQPRPLTLDDVEAHKGLKTNVFPMERRAAWLKRIGSSDRAFTGVTEPKARR